MIPVPEALGQKKSSVKKTCAMIVIPTQYSPTAVASRLRAHTLAPATPYDCTAPVVSPSELDARCSNLISARLATSSPTFATALFSKHFNASRETFCTSLHYQR